MPPLISIIVPVYNSEKTLHLCVDSILNQTFTDWELLLIDDGSKDKSGEICEEYAAKDCRIKVFHKVNGGVSSARNLGLDNAIGKWITFVDSDDYILDDVFNLIIKYDEDIIVFPFYISDGKQQMSQFNLIPSVSCHDKNLTISYLEKYVHLNIFRSPWSKFFKKDIINDIRFDETVIIGEDTIFVYNYLKKCISLRVCSVFFYVWICLDKDDRIKYELSVDSSVSTLSKVYNAYKKLGVYSKEFELFVYLYYKSLCGKDIDKKPSIWYKNKDLFKVWCDIKKSFSIKYRCRFFLYKYFF